MNSHSKPRQVIQAPPRRWPVVVAVGATLTLAAVGYLGVRAPVERRIEDSTVGVTSVASQPSGAVPAQASRANDERGVRALVYRVAFDVGYSLPPNEQTVSVAGEGTLELFPVPAEGKGSRWVGAIKEPSLALDSDTSAFGAVPDLLADLSTPFSFATDERGAVTAVGFRSRGANQGQSIARAVLAVLEFVRPSTPAPRWSVEEPDSNGRCVADYTAKGPAAFAKEKSRCPFLVALQFGTLRQAEVRAHADYQLAPDGHVAQVSSQESLALAVGEGKIVTSAKISLTRAPGQVASLPYPDFETWLMGPLYGAAESRKETPAEALRWKRELTRDKTFGSITESMLKAVAAGNDSVRLKALQELEALFDVDPASIALALDSLKGELPPEAIEALVGALAGAESPQAQAALNTLASDAAYGAEVRNQAVTHLGLLEHPTSETLGTLEKLANDPDSGVREAATLARGGAARHAAPGSEEAERTHSQLERAYQGTQDEAEKDLLLAALGNAGASSSLELIRQTLLSPDPTRRAAAVLALRFIPGDEASQLIGRTLSSDAEASVRSAAVQALEFRAFEPSIATLILDVFPREVSSMVRTNMLGLLARNLTNPLPAVVATVRLAQADRDREVREIADRMASQIL